MSSMIRLVAMLGLMTILEGSLAAGPAAVLLGTAGNFAILAKTGVSTVPNSAVSGDVGVSPAATTALTGFSLVADPSGTFWTSTQVTGRLMGASDRAPTPGVLTTAVSDMQTAYTSAMGRTNPNFVGLAAGLIGGFVLPPGLYKWTTGVSISRDVTLSGSAADTWIFQISGGLTQAANSHILLVGGALSSNIVWVVAGVVTVGTGATFEGNILAKTNVVLQTGAIDHGCIYAQTAVTLQKATVSCGSGTVPPPPSSSSVPPSSTSAPPTSTVSSTVPPTSTPTSVCKPTPVGLPCYTTAFQNLTASVHGDDYLTYILTDTVDECLQFCMCRVGCAFANPYYDNNAKNTTQLTCAIYKGCHTAADATNTGGQTEPDGGVSSITSSDGYCLEAC